jgi:glutathione synthase/RimK-type ligase-like ATP-grasp enzyme
VILLCGIPSERALVLVREELERLAVPVATFNQRLFDQIDLQFELVQGRARGVLRLPAQRIDLETVSGVYTRVMDEQALPELRAERRRSPLRRRAAALHRALADWCEVTPARVVNRARPQGSNASKPYQAELLRRLGLDVPETLITNDPDLVRDFVARHRRVVYKSASGIRSVVRILERADLERLDRIAWCPVQFQAYVPGFDVRVHVVADEVFATRVRTNASDYRYAATEGIEAPSLDPVELDNGLAQSCIRVAEALELPFAGIDLRIGSEGQPTFFEVNPSPAFTYYEDSTGQRIARALALHLAGG